MDTPVFLAALLSALLHAGWNAAVKAHPQPQEAMAGQMVGAALIGAPALLWLGLPPLAALPWMLLSTAINTMAVLTLLRAYRSGDFGTVYPVARAVSVMGVAGAAPLLMGESLGLPAGLGVGLVALALALLAWDAHSPGRGVWGGRALAWTLVSGACTAGYVLADAAGVRAGAHAGGSALSYGFAVSILNALAIGWVQRRVGHPLQLFWRHARLTVPAAMVSSLSYLLILWAYQKAPVAQAAALRDTSAVFAMLIGAIWLHEPLRPRRWALLLVALAGVALLRLG